MTDHAVLIPTSEGPVGGIVSEPEGEPRARMILLQGYGRPGRSGTNSFWTRIARDLAALGVIVLRYDYAREGETLPLGEGGSGLAWKRDLDFSLAHQVAPWFAERAGDVPLLLAGACAGTRVAIELGAAAPDRLAAVLLVALDLRTVIDEGTRGPGVGDPDVIDPQAVERLREIMRRAPAWVLVGEHDILDVPALTGALGPTRCKLEAEVVPDATLHFLDQPDIQHQTHTRLVARAARVLSRPEPLTGATS